MSICISSILSTIHPESWPVQISNLCFNSSYALFKLNIWFVTVIASDLRYIVSISYLLIALFHLFKELVANKLYLKPLFPSNKSLNKSIILFFAKNNESLKLVLSVTSTL